MARRLLGSAGDTALRNLTHPKNGAPVTTEQQPPEVWWDRDTNVVITDCPSWPTGTFTPVDLVRLVPADEVEQLRTENERLSAYVSDLEASIDDDVLIWTQQHRDRREAGS